jgi:hypothetical protein
MCLHEEYAINDDRLPAHPVLLQPLMYQVQQGGGLRVHALTL